VFSSTVSWVWPITSLHCLGHMCSRYANSGWCGHQGISKDACAGISEQPSWLLQQLVEWHQWQATTEVQVTRLHVWWWEPGSWITLLQFYANSTSCIANISGLSYRRPCTNARVDWCQCIWLTTACWFHLWPAYGIWDLLMPKSLSSGEQEQYLALERLWFPDSSAVTCNSVPAESREYNRWLLQRLQGTWNRLERSLEGATGMHCNNHRDGLYILWKVPPDGRV